MVAGDVVQDGPAYHPVVCTVSLGGSLCLNLHRATRDNDNDNDNDTPDPVPAVRILQEPRSLLVITGELYTDYLHGIEDVARDLDLGPGTVANWHLLGSDEPFRDGCNDRGARTSLTYRDVIRVSGLGSRLGSFLGRAAAS